MIKMAGGLSITIKAERGNRQGCPLSGQLYSIHFISFSFYCPQCGNLPSVS